MPRYSADLYVDGIYVKTYFTEDDDPELAQDRVKEIAESEIMIDLEEIDG